MFLKTPNKNDAEMFKGVLFEDAMGPSIKRYLFVPDEFKNDKKVIDNMIWKEAASLLLSYSSASTQSTKANSITINPDDNKKRIKH